MLRCINWSKTQSYFDTQYRYTNLKSIEYLWLQSFKIDDSSLEWSVASFHKQRFRPKIFNKIGRAHV